LAHEVSAPSSYVAGWTASDAHNSLNNAVLFPGLILLGCLRFFAVLKHCFAFFLEGAKIWSKGPGSSGVSRLRNSDCGFEILVLGTGRDLIDFRWTGPGGFGAFPGDPAKTPKLANFDHAISAASRQLSSGACHRSVNIQGVLEKNVRKVLGLLV
jgi:hypothetical protein